LIGFNACFWFPIAPVKEKKRKTSDIVSILIIKIIRKSFKLLPLFALSNQKIHTK